MKRYNANQAQPWSNLNLYGAGLGAVQPMSVGGSTTTPYFQNQLADTLAGISGATGIGKSLLGRGDWRAGSVAGAELRQGRGLGQAS